MSEDNAADGDDGKTPVKLSPGALEALTHGILEDTLYNIISSIALSCHRSEKQLRMQSAATQAETLALSALDPPSVKGAGSQTAPPTAKTPAAVYENGRVFLKGNPLQTTPDITCPHCKLPRLMHPIMGKGMQNPDLSKEYCMLYPWVQRPGHDVYGNPFPTDMAKSKKERELMRAQHKAEKDNVGTPGSVDVDTAQAASAADTTANSGSHNNKEIKLNTGGKPASYIPWHTCPNCKRSLLITRFAQHLEKCLGISGRQSSRNAMAKLTGQNGDKNGTGSGFGSTPLGSRLGTPAPGSQTAGGGEGKGKDKRASPTKRDDDDGAGGGGGGDENETPEKKKKKKSSYIKKADRERMLKEGSIGGSGGLLKVKVKSKDPTKEGGDGTQRKGGGGESNADGKRDRDRDEGGGEDAPRKKIKLTFGKENDGKAGGSSSAVGKPSSSSAGGEGKEDAK